MTCEILEANFAFGPFPASPVASAVALEASTTEAAALAAIQSAWTMAETYTRRHFRPVTAGKVIVRTKGPTLWRWPGWPFPDAIAVDAYVQGSWQPYAVLYLADLGEVDLECFMTYRLQCGAVAAPVIKPNVTQAVRNLASYLMVQDPARREFKSQGAGDSNLTREGYMGPLYASGCGSLLASEVRL